MSVQSDYFLFPEQSLMSGVLERSSESLINGSVLKTLLHAGFSEMRLWKTLGTISTLRFFISSSCSSEIIIVTY